MLEVVKVKVKAKEARAKGVKAKAAAKEEGTIKTIYPIYQNRLAYKRLKRIIVHLVIRRAISRGPTTHIKGLKNLYSKSLRNLLI